MHICCPHCRHEIDLVKPGELSVIDCPSCKSTLSISISVAEPTVLTARDASTTGPAGKQTSTPVAATGDGGAVKSQPGHFKEGAEFGNYLIKKEIARGGMGVVFAAQQISLNRPVALKMILSSHLAEPDEVRRFYVEAEAAAKLNHPGIVPVYEVGEVGGQHFFSMELVHGGSLANLYSKKLPGSRRAAELVWRIAAAIQYAHTKNIVHRDLKPSNILLDQHGQPKVSDFGLAKDIAADTGLTATGEIIGTPGYMAPEQAAGKLDEVGPLADVYGLGGILYFLLTGLPPFKGKTPIETVRKVIEEEPAPPRKLAPKTDRDLETICLKCLHKDIGRRYASAKELLDEIQRYLDRKPILARPVSLRERTWLWCRRRPTIAGSMAVILLILCIATGITLVERHRNTITRMQTTIGSLTSTRGVILPPLTDLDKFPREPAIEELRARFRADTSGRLPLAYALAHFGEPPFDYLLEQVESVSTDEFENLVQALGMATGVSIKKTRTAAEAAEADENWRYKARLGMLLLRLEEPGPAQDMCRLRSDPVQRTQFIEACSTWHGDLSKLVSVAVNNNDIPLRTAIVLAAGSTPDSDVLERDRQIWEPRLSEWYQNHPDTLLHSAAGWTLRKWKLRVPEITPGEASESGRNWQINRIGITMLKIPAGSFVRQNPGTTDYGNGPTVNLEHSFLMADREVTREQFQEFIDDPACPDTEKPQRWTGADIEFSPTGQHPVQEVSWYDAVLFCNWLSRLEGLKPCYERTGEKEKIGITQQREHDAWKLIKDANGYRLPTEAEWEYASRAGVRTAYCFGEEISMLDRYAVYRANQAELPGTRLPNAWGLFDVHGNVCEWCYDWYGAPRGDGKRVRGGSFVTVAEAVRLDHRSYYLDPDSRGKHTSFRVARTCP